MRARMREAAVAIGAEDEVLLGHRFAGLPVENRLFRRWFRNRGEGRRKGGAS